MSKVPKELLDLIKELDRKIIGCNKELRNWTLSNKSSLKILKGDNIITKNSNEIVTSLAIESRVNTNFYTEAIRILREEKAALLRDWKDMDEDLEDLMEF